MLMAARFLHVHVDLVGPLPTSAGYIYCLIAVDRFTRWTEVVPIPDITTDTVARALLTGWISRFDWPQTIKIDQGSQFESQLFQSLVRLCVIQLSRTIAHHPAANGLVERFNRTLKAAIMFHADLQDSVAELVYGKPLRIPIELMTPIADPVEPAHLISQLCQKMACLSNSCSTPRLPGYISAQQPPQVYACLLHQDTTRHALELPYSE
jgi:cleavage and polyadenylation specificity factor subunit 1